MMNRMHETVGVQVKHLPMKGLLLALLHVALVGAIAGKLLYDRQQLPRLWVQTAPFDPDLPLRGRYVQLRLLLDNKHPPAGMDESTLLQPVPFFIPEHVPDPSVRPTAETLWVEVSLPPKGPPRPIQLGVKTGQGAIVPLALR
jgi:hypothetical protein